MLIGDRVTLRLVEEEDLALLVRWRNTPRIWDCFFNKFPIAMGAQRDWYAQLRQSTTYKLFMICSAPASVPVGTIGLDHLDFVDRSAELGGLLIGEDADLGKGYAKEAMRLLLEYCFMRLNLHRVYAHIYAHNEPSVRLFRRSGFEDEGRLREARFDRGAYRDVLVMSILASEYRSA
jgi:RimJ/RimL family protein N-acetyltransferase